MSNKETARIPFETFVKDTIKDNPGVKVTELVQYFSTLLSESFSKEDVRRETYKVVTDLIKDEVWIDAYGKLFENYEVGIKHQSGTTIVFKIDPNVRVKGNRTYVDESDLLKGELNDIYVGQEVDVVEVESRLRGSAVVYEIDSESQLIFLEVPWKELKVDIYAI